MQVGIAETLVDAALLIALTFGGGLAALVAWTGSFDLGSLWQDLALIVAVAVVSGLVGLPFSYLQTFGIEA
jgi:STE24 endopeptidase